MYAYEGGAFHCAKVRQKFRILKIIAYFCAQKHICQNHSKLMRHVFRCPAARTLFFLITLALTVQALAQNRIPARPMTGKSRLLTRLDTVRIMSYNIYHGEGLDGRHDYGRVADLIRREQADIVAVQEVDSVTRRSHGADVLKQIADSAGMTCTFARTLAYEGGAYGIGLLSKTEPLRVQTYALPGREEPRALLVAEFDNYVVACTHLSLTTDDQLASIYVVRAVAAQTQKPFFLAGDWNAEPGDSTIAEMQRHFTLADDLTALSYPADRPTQLLDYIGLWNRHNNRVSLQDFHVVDERVASDHRPVVATYEIKVLAGRRLGPQRLR